MADERSDDELFAEMVANFGPAPEVPPTPHREPFSLDDSLWGEFHPEPAPALKRPTFKEGWPWVLVGVIPLGLVVAAMLGVHISLEVAYAGAGCFGVGLAVLMWRIPKGVLGDGDDGARV